MPKIFFAKGQFPALEVQSGENLMAALLTAGVPVASSCHGDGVCAKCRVRILKGALNLSPPNPTEIFLMENNGFSPDVRISCQTQVMGDVTIDATYW